MTSYLILVVDLKTHITISAISNYCKKGDIFQIFDPHQKKATRKYCVLFTTYVLCTYVESGRG